MTASEPHAALGMRELESIRTRVDDVLFRFLAHERKQIAEEHAPFLPLLDEIERIVRAGGKRLRPAFCVLGYRWSGGEDTGAIWHAAAALELFHTFALIHDDVMDRAEARRGVPTIHARTAAERPDDPDAERFGISAAVLAGDLTLVLADRLFLDSGFPPDVLIAAFRHYNGIRVQVAVGQYLDIATHGRDVDEDEARRIAALKSGSYTVLGPLQIGVLLAGGRIDPNSALSRYGTSLGEAFQICDDLEGALRGTLDLAQAKPTVLLAKGREMAAPDDRRFLDERLGRGALSDPDRDRAVEILLGSGAIEATVAMVNQLVNDAAGALEQEPLEPDVARALRSLAELVAVPAQG